VAEGYLTKEEEEYFSSGGAKEPENIEEYANDAEQSNGDQGDAGSDTSPDDRAEDAEEDPADTPDDEEVEGTTSSDDDGIESEEPAPGKKRDLEKAFKTERHKRKEMREKLEANEARTRELEARLAQLQDTLNRTNQQAPQPAAPPEEIPDPDEDPLGYQQYKINKLEQTIKSQSDYLRQQHEYTQRTQQEAAFREQYKAQAQEYAQKQPDFMDAYSYLMSSRLQEHLAAGFSEQQAQQLLVEDEIAVASLAFKDRVNPAERIYSIAKARGYVPNQKGKQAKSPSIDSIKKGLDNAKSLKSGGGELPNRMQGIDEIDGMSFDEFDKFWAGYRNKAKAR